MSLTALLSAAVTVALSATALSTTALPLTSSDAAREALAEASRLPGAPDVVMSSVENFPLHPGDELRLPAAEVDYRAGYPRPVDDTITETALTSREITGENLERWVVNSASMNRPITVEIFLGGDTQAPAPHFYLFDGATNDEGNNWIYKGGLIESLSDQDVSVILPVGARGSMFADWIRDDPALGRNKWETFVTKELPVLVEKHLERPDNGRRAIGGLSMGAAGAVRIANNNPELYDGVMGLSGCYSTLDKPGWLSTELTVQGRGGDTANMWGEYGSPEWVAADVDRDPRGLGEMAVYLSAATGVLGADDRAEYSTRPPEDTFRGIYLERTTYDCTASLDESLRAHGFEHHVVDYLDEGAHNWTNYGAQLRPGWEAISHALY